MARMSMVTILMCLVIWGTKVLNLVVATDYTVGGPNGGWDSITNLQAWASLQPLSVGDNLIFQYAPNHNVIEVTKTDYDSCQATNAVQKYTDGATTISLSTPGKRYFICGTPGHCMQGMKIEVNTLAATTSFAPSPSLLTAPLTDESPMNSPMLSPLTSSPTYGPSLSPLTPFAAGPVSGFGLEPLPISSDAQVTLVAGGFTIVLGVVMMMVSVF